MEIPVYVFTNFSTLTLDKRILRLDNTYSYADQFPSLAIAEVIWQSTLIASTNSDVQYSGMLGHWTRSRKFALGVTL